MKTCIPESIYIIIKTKILHNNLLLKIYTTIKLSHLIFTGSLKDALKFYYHFTHEEFEFQKYQMTAQDIRVNKR